MKPGQRDTAPTTTPRSPSKSDASGTQPYQGPGNTVDGANNGNNGHPTQDSMSKPGPER